MRIAVLVLTMLITGCMSESYVDEVIDIKEDLTLSSNVYKTKFTLATPGVVVDGGGHTIDGRCNTDCVGLVIAADNVVVRNVTIRGFDVFVLRTWMLLITFSTVFSLIRMPAALSAEIARYLTTVQWVYILSTTPMVL